MISFMHVRNVMKFIMAMKPLSMELCSGFVKQIL